MIAISQDPLLQLDSNRGWMACTMRTPVSLQISIFQRAH